MKAAVIYVGSHFAGKSYTINTCLKPLLKISERSHRFVLKDKHGWVLSQSFEEANCDAEERLERYANLDLLVLAARPPSEKHSMLLLAEKVLRKNGFRPYRIDVARGSESPRVL